MVTADISGFKKISWQSVMWAVWPVIIEIFIFTFTTFLPVICIVLNNL